MLAAAGVPVTIDVPRLDEAAIRTALVAEGATPRDIADALAEAKARKSAGRHPGAMVLGSDQVLALDGAVYDKAETPEILRGQLRALAGQTHQLLSAAVLFDQGRPVWRHVSVARLTMRPLSDAFIADYVARSWDNVRGSVGGYRIEGEGVRLMERIEGDHFTILGLPLVPLLNYLVLRGVLSS
jgi:septum formation protein